MLRHGSSKSFCSMKPTCGLGPSTDSPPSDTMPSLGRSRPATRLRMVLLPQPDGPTIATNSPSRTEKLSRSTAVKRLPGAPGAGKRRVTAFSSSALADAVMDIRREPFDRPGLHCWGRCSYLNYMFIIDQLMKVC